jgi:undecaprenyl-diphosphatase
VAASAAERVLVGVIGLALVVGAGVALRWLTAGLGGQDTAAMVDVVHWRGSLAIQIAHAGSVLGRGWVLLPLAAAAGWALRRGGRGWIPLWSVLLAIAAQNVVKEIVRRPRPPVRHLEHVTSWSFPSGHAAETTALSAAVVIAAWPLVATRWARCAAVTAAIGVSLLVAASRVVLGVHYPTDVAAGCVLGALTAALALAFARPRTQRSIG